MGASSRPASTSTISSRRAGRPMASASVRRGRRRISSPMATRHSRRRAYASPTRPQWSCYRRRPSVPIVTYGRAFIAGILVLVGALLPAAVGAQITIDGSLRPGTAGPLTGPNFVIGSGVGRTVGNNLFHSFGQFNVGAAESATFTGPASIGNVISRVTGGQLSSINGLIDTRTFMTRANFFLLNPAGIMLGAGASLNVGGAFHLSTADYLCLGSGGCLADPTAGKFFASLGRGDVLTVAAPAAFGFLGPPTGSIVVDGSILPGIPDPPVGQTMSLVGGSILVTGGAMLSPPGGRVQLVSVNSAGEVPISSLDVRGFSALGSITVSGSVIDV